MSIVAILNPKARNGRVAPRRYLPPSFKVLETEAAAILALVPRLDGGFDRAIELLHGCRGRVILTGMGKSGIISRKIAATLTSTGTAAVRINLGWPPQDAHCLSRGVPSSRM